MKPLQVTLNNRVYVFVYAGIENKTVRFDGPEHVNLLVTYNEQTGVVKLFHGLQHNEYHASGYAGVCFLIKSKLAEILGLTDYEKYQHGIAVEMSTWVSNLQVCESWIYVYTFYDSKYWFYAIPDGNNSTTWESALFPPSVIPSTEHALQQIIKGEL